MKYEILWNPELLTCSGLHSALQIVCSVHQNVVPFPQLWAWIGLDQDCSFLVNWLC